MRDEGFDRSRSYTVHGRNDTFSAVTIVTRSVSEGMTCVPRLRFGLRSFSPANSITRFRWGYCSLRMGVNYISPQLLGLRGCGGL